MTAIQRRYHNSDHLHQLTQLAVIVLSPTFSIGTRATAWNPHLYVTVLAGMINANRFVNSIKLDDTSDVANTE